MSTDVPDFTGSVHVVGSDIIFDVNVINAVLDVNIQSATKLDINIASITTGVVFNVAQSGAWTVDANITNATIDINIQSVAEGVTFNVNIASAVTIDVNITNAEINVKVTNAEINVNITNEVLQSKLAKSALCFGEDGDRVECPNLIGANQSFTVLVRAKVFKFTDYWGLASESVDPDRDWELRVETDGSIRILLWDSGGTWHGATAKPNLFKDGEFHTAGIAYDYGTGKLYIIADGELIDTGVTSPDLRDTGSPFRVGFTYTDVNSLRGIVSWALAYNRVLSSDEVLNIHNNPSQPPREGLILRWDFDEGSGNKVYDKSGNGNDGTIYGATWVSEQGQVSATLNVNIQASQVVLDIDIEAQTAVLNINDVNLVDKTPKTGALVHKDNVANHGTEVNIYTVPSGYVLYLCGAIMTIHKAGSTAGAEAFLRVLIGGTTSALLLARAAAPGDDDTVTYSPATPLPYPEGTVFSIDAGPFDAGWARGIIMGTLVPTTEAVLDLAWNQRHYAYDMQIIKRFDKEFYNLLRKEGVKEGERWAPKDLTEKIDQELHEKRVKLGIYKE